MNLLTFPILRLLADGKFHSGEKIAQNLKISRATVWNALKEAEKLGIKIFSVPGRGYKLPDAITLLDAQVISKSLGDTQKWFKLEIHDYLESTNTYLIKEISNGNAQINCVATNLQTKGRGRRGRRWQSGLGASLTFSLLWRFQCGASGLSGLSLAVGVALIRALHSFGIYDPKLKWPNDILVGAEKLAGILIELQGDMEGQSLAVIGIGINLNLPINIKEEIDQPSTDLASQTKESINPNELLGILLRHLVEILCQFEKHGFISVREEWTRHHAYQDKTVKLLHSDGTETKGTVINVAEDGILILRTEFGEKRFSSGEISLRESE